MTEEKKEEKQADPKPQAQQPQAQTPALNPVAPAAAPSPAPSTAATAEKSQAPSAPVKKEKPSNCAKCNKSIKNKRWYYRNGKFYCTKTCWQTTLKKETPEEKKA